MCGLNYEAVKQEIDVLIRINIVNPCGDATQVYDTKIEVARKKGEAGDYICCPLEVWWSTATGVL